jgi:cytochrome bd-type quinol oxidase subunit 2
MADRREASRIHKPTLVALIVGAVWGIGLLVAAVWAPAYQSSSLSSSGVPPNGTATLVQENGTGVLAPVALPLLGVVFVTLALWRRRRRARPGAGTVPWVVLAGVAAITLLSMLTIGPFLLPVTVSLAVACASA